MLDCGSGLIHHGHLQKAGDPESQGMKDIRHGMISVKHTQNSGYPATETEAAGLFKEQTQTDHLFGQALLGTQRSEIIWTQLQDTWFK